MAPKEMGVVLRVLIICLANEGNEIKVASFYSMDMKVIISINK